MLIANGLPLANYIAYYAGFLVCGVICASKGKFWFAALGVVVPLFWIVGAVRPARPGSIWARIRGTYFDHNQQAPEDNWH